MWIVILSFPKARIQKSRKKFAKICSEGGPGGLEVLTMRSKLFHMKDLLSVLPTQDFRDN